MPVNPHVLAAVADQAPTMDAAHAPATGWNASIGPLTPSSGAGRDGLVAVSANHVSARLVPHLVERQGDRALDLHELTLVAKMATPSSVAGVRTTADGSESSSACQTRPSNARSSAAT